MNHTEDLRIKSLRPLVSPSLLYEEYPATKFIIDVVTQARLQAARIIHGEDDRLLVIIGPCSIHDPKGALDYASKLKDAAESFKDDLHIIMRVYFEKPRTRIGWKGLINDPYLDNSFDVHQGLRIARKLLLEINELGVPAGTEFLDTIIPQYQSDLISWGAIGARTTESQIHRELASGLSMPIGFKNATNGNVQVAVDAVSAAHHPHHFLGATKHGLAAIVGTTGNDDSHIILRGSNTGPNYEAEYVQEAAKALNDAKMARRIMIDCSHGNSNKDFTRQPIVAASICQQIIAGSNELCGVMVESNLVEGKQTLTDKNKLVYGQSVTDACIGWDDSVKLLSQLAQAVQKRRALHQTIKG